MGTHSVILGGSNAQRLLACPASYLESQRAPVTDMESDYAAEGTMLHGAIAYCIERGFTAAVLRNTASVPTLELDGEQHATLAKGLDELENLKTKYGSKGRKWRVLALEKTFHLPGVTGAFGSVDLVLTNGAVILVIDWK